MDTQRIVMNCITDPNGCWIWQKSCNSAGYGQLTENKTYWLAHRYSYAAYNKDLSASDVVRHQCCNPKCCNPEHLLIGTHKDNWHDSAEAHRKASALQRSRWLIEGIEYPTMREAQKRTGISMGALNKHTINGVFNTAAYRSACKKANKPPKI